MSADKIINEVKSHRDSDFAEWVSPILQVAKGGYGESDKLYGVRTPVLRRIAKDNQDTDIAVVEELLHNDYHEIRMTALLILILKYRNNKYDRDYIVDLYLKNADYINNWDLVDVSAPNIVGQYVYENRDKVDMLYELSETDHLWKQRIAVVSTQYLIKQGFYEPTIKLAEKYFYHPHHLIHKATGWMLRELGKKDIDELYSFLDKFAPNMPRVMLRYALERLPENKRKYYMMLK